MRHGSWVRRQASCVRRQAVVSRQSSVVTLFFEAMSTVPMLSVKGLNAWYGESHVLHGVDFVVNQGEVVTLLGRNGVGKTTTLKSVMGMVGRREGSIAFEGRETIA